MSLTPRPFVFGDLEFDQVFTVCLEGVEHPHLVGAHEAGVADHVGGQNRGKTSFHQITRGSPVSE